MRNRSYKWHLNSIIWSIGFVFMLLLIACKKGETDEGLAPDGEKPSAIQANWEVIRSFAREDSYTKVALAQFQGQAFISTYGYSGIGPGSGGSLSDNLRGTYFYKIGADWYRYATTDEAVIQFKVFNNELYGIRLKQTISSRVPVIAYNHEYTLFKWVNNNFSDIAKFSLKPAGQMNGLSLGDLKFWVNQQRLHIVSATNSSILIWQLNGNQLQQIPLEQNFSAKYILPIDNKEVAFTMVTDKIVNPERTETTVQGLYYNGSAFRQGNRQVFIVDGPTSTKDAFNYIAANGQLWGLGYQNRNLKNYDNGQITFGTASGNKISGTLMIPKEGKLYTMVEKETVMGSCEAIALWDGQTYQEIKYVLPSTIDKCSIIQDISVDNAQTYSLVLTNFSYVLLKAK
ncbi:MAG: hypothetical protein EOO99_06140 [Pedobacter sp.]|nr:MAG: hypothetical protein EOO99_06140 [Pedobacter sp.]